MKKVNPSRFWDSTKLEDVLTYSEFEWMKNNDINSLEKNENKDLLIVLNKDGVKE